MRYVLLVPVLSLLCGLRGLCGQFQDEERIRSLIDRLSDDDIVSRDKAAAELAEYGKLAIPSLEKLKVSQDVDLRSRAASILKMIGEMEVVGRHWRRGARISFEFTATPVAAVLQELEKQGRDKFKMDAAALQDPITVKVRDATFWEALEAVVRAAPSLTWDGDGDELTFTKQRRPPFPAKRQAEFTVWLDNILFARDNEFTGNPRSTFTLSLTAAWEAGIAPVAVDQKLTEVLDEDGNNLITPDRYGYGSRLDPPKGRLRKDAVFLPVQAGSKPAKRFSRVRGSSAFYFPKSYEDVQFDLRTPPSPAVLDRLTLAVRNFRVVKDGVACELVMTVAMGANDGMIDRLPFNEISVIDDQGGQHRSRTSSRTHSYSGTSYTINENLQVPFPEGRTAVGLKARILKDVLEKRVNFEFEDIPLE